MAGLNAVSIANTDDGRIVLLRAQRDPKAPPEALLLLALPEALWWAAQLVYGICQANGVQGPVAAVFRELVGGEVPPTKSEIAVKLWPTPAGVQVVTFRGDHQLLGLWPAAADAIGLQLVDAIRKARGLEPVAIPRWKAVVGYAAAFAQAKTS